MTGFHMQHKDGMQPLSEQHADVPPASEEAFAFEGPEKKLEVYFSAASTQSGFRDFPEPTWDALLADASCTILHRESNEHFDAYLLSESSLFVYPRRVILKTCGTTTLLLVLPKVSRPHAWPMHRRSLDRLPAGAWDGSILVTRLLPEPAPFVLMPLVAPDLHSRLCWTLCSGISGMSSGWAALPHRAGFPTQASMSLAHVRFLFSRCHGFPGPLTRNAACSQDPSAVYAARPM